MRGMACFVLVALTACSSFGSDTSSTTPPAPSPPPGAPPSPGDAGDDAQAPPGPPLDCTDGPLLCDDFERPKVLDGSKWKAGSGGSSVNVIITADTAVHRSLTTSARFDETDDPAASRTYLYFDPASQPAYDLRLAFRIDRLPAKQPNEVLQIGGFAYLGSESPTPSVTVYKIFVDGAGFGVFEQFVTTASTATNYKEYRPVGAAPIAAGKFYDVHLHVERSTDTNTTMASLDGDLGTISLMTLTNKFPGAPRVELGVDFQKPSKAQSLWLDDVRLE